MALKIKLKSFRNGGCEYILRNLLIEHNLKLPLIVNAEMDHSFTLPITRISDGPFKGWSASNFKFEIVEK